MQTLLSLANILGVLLFWVAFTAWLRTTYVTASCARSFRLVRNEQNARRFVALAYLASVALDLASLSVSAIHPAWSLNGVLLAAWACFDWGKAKGYNTGYDFAFDYGYRVGKDVGNVGAMLSLLTDEERESVFAGMRSGTSPVEVADNQDGEPF